MPLLRRLIGSGFLNSYFGCVGNISRQLALKFEVDDDRLRDAYDSWANDIIQSEQKKLISPENFSYFEDVLSRFGSHFATTACVSYLANGNSPSGALRSDHQQLAIEFASEYTALEFARSFYMEWWLSLRDIEKISGASGILYYSSTDVRQHLSEIRLNPSIAGEMGLFLNMHPGIG